jgi:hypothetical protein
MGLPIEENPYFYDMTEFWRKKNFPSQKRLALPDPKLVEKVANSKRRYEIRIYKDKYVMHNENIPREIKTFNHKFDYVVHKLSINGHKDVSKVVIPDTWVLYLGRVRPSWGLTVDSLPPHLMSLSFSLSDFPYNGADLTRFKNFKIITAYGRTVYEIPKLPKSIEYITFNNSTLDHEKSGVKKFTYKDHPNLKWLDLRNSVSAKYLAADIKQAAKDGKIKLFYGYNHSDYELKVVK